MRFSAAQDLTAKALQQTSRVVQPQNTMAVLTGIQLDASDGRLKLSATDLSNLIVAEVPCSVEEPGFVVLPASTLTELIQRLPTATFEMTAEATTGRATVQYGRNHATINGFGSDSLPIFPDFDQQPTRLALAAGIIATLSRQLLFACSKDDTRPILKGVYIKIADGRLVMVATDGSRLSHTWIAIPEYRGEAQEFVISPKVLTEGARISTGESIDITISNTLVQMQVPNMTFTARLLDGQYPDYDRVMPQDFIAQCRIPISEFRGAVERVNLIAARERSTPLRLRMESGLVELSTQAAEIGQAQETIECQTQGQDIDILFNPTYILDALKSLEGEDAIMEFSGMQSPARIREAEGSQYFHILLPLRQLV